MDYTRYFQTNCLDPAYNLAFEEYILTNYRQGNILILWQNKNAVIIGRNQNTLEEIDPNFVAANSIQIIRRNTGGGAVYHDLGNLNYSFICDAGDAGKDAMKPFLNVVVQALCDLGLDAKCSGRNDILVSEKKVSGTAQQLSNGRLLHHGTLLFDSDPEMIAGALKPDPCKFQSKSIKSVKSRVGNIRTALSSDMDISAFWDYLKIHLTNDCFQICSLSDDELHQIQLLKQKKYDTWEWNYGKSPQFTLHSKKRFPGGLLDIHLCVHSGKISEIKIYGDFLSLCPVSDIEAALTGCLFRHDAMQHALSGLDLQSYLGTITQDMLIDTILSANS